MQSSALAVLRADNFSEWYQAVVREADMADLSPVRGCMVIKPWGYGIWELLQRALDDRIKALGFENCYFPLFIPMSFIAKESEHVDGFAKEMAVVTHHRLRKVGGKLELDPEAVLEEPLVVRPTSETIIGDSFRGWIQSYRDLPLRINQWANVVRWELRTRPFLRTAEFLWHECHSAHAGEAEARESTIHALEVYSNFAETVLAMPTIAGEKPENERFPGADNTYSIEALMQDGKALQAGTSHYLGTHFSEAQGIKFQNKLGGESYCYTTSWGLSTRMIGALIMVHGDDDGFRCPPKVAPRQVIIVPILREKPEDSEIIAACQKLHSDLLPKMPFGSSLRAFVDLKPIKSANKRWNWIRRGAPIICEIGLRDASHGMVTFIRRDNLRDGDKVLSHTVPLYEFVENAAALLGSIQDTLLNQAKERLRSGIRSDLITFEELVKYYGTDDDGSKKGWVRCAWAKPTGIELENVVERLKGLKLTIRGAPLDQPATFRRCIFSGAPGVEDIVIARTY